jgi:superfamily II DNA or RNA helicase
MIQLYKHQRDILMQDKPKSLIALGCGGGKTLVALFLARGKTLVITTKTVKAEKTWENELKKTYGNSGQTHIKDGKEIPATMPHIDMTVISKEVFRREAHALPRYETVICDEGHHMLGAQPVIRWRNKKPIVKASQMFEAIDEFLRRTKPERLYLVTATPTRSPMAIWAAAKLLGYNYSFENWRHQFYVRLPMPGREVWAPKKDTASKEALGKVVRGLGYTGKISDWIDLPPQVFKTVYVELTTEQKNAIKDARLNWPEPIVQCGKIHQIDQGVLAGDQFNKPEFFSNEKIEKILDYCLEFPRFIIWARYTAQIEQIATAIKSTGKKVLTLTGDTKNRAEVLEEARNSQECVLICQSSLSEGWNLGEYDVTVFASLDWSVVSYIQSVGRTNRINHPSPNLYIHLVVRGSMDERVYKAVVETKMDFHLAMYD